jgi:hypothetical protein
MNAPDKIYMPNELLSEEWQRHIEGEDTEYIRKEALTEWLKSELENGGPTTLVQHIINRINSL